MFARACLQLVCVISLSVHVLVCVCEYSNGGDESDGMVVSFDSFVWRFTWCSSVCMCLFMRFIVYSIVIYSETDETNV